MKVIRRLLSILQEKVFSKGDSEYSVIAANNTGSQRTGQAKVAASEGGKTITVTLTQAGV